MESLSSLLASGRVRPGMNSPAFTAMHLKPPLCSASQLMYLDKSRRGKTKRKTTEQGCIHRHSRREEDEAVNGEVELGALLRLTRAALDLARTMEQIGKNPTLTAH